ncbi:MAG: ATP-binding protein, partial [Pseudomonadota bacterium]
QVVDRNEWVKLGHATRAFIVTTQLARAYSALDRHTEAVAELAPWLQRSDLNPGPDLMNDARTALAEAYLALGDYDAAERHIRQARAQIAASDVIGTRDEFDILEASLARARGDLDGASDALATIVAKLSQGDPTTAYLDALHLQADVFSELGEFPAAFTAQRRALQVERVLRTADFDRRMSVALVASENEASQRELEMLRAGERLAQTRSERDRIFDIALIGVGALLVLVAYLIWLQWYREHSARTRLEKTVAERTEQVRQELERRVDAERAKRLLEHRLVEDEKYRAVARLTGGLAHDFNNLMTVVSCSAELIKLGANDGDIDALAEDILDAADSGTRVTRSLIAYARQQALQPEQLQLDEFLIDNEALIRNTLGESIELVLDLAPARVEIDRGSLTTALLNVLFNAREAISRDGRVDIRLRADDAPDGRQFYRLSIRDNGTGMDEETVQRSMEPFFSTRRSDTGKSSGLGLGLSTVYGFMRQSEGNVEIESTLNNGTTVHLLFPAVTAQSSSGASEPVSRTSRFSTISPMVLLVEDQDKIRLLTRRALEATGYRVRDCASGSEAIEALNGQTGFDVLVSDIVMPGPFNGIDVARTARKLNPSMQILLTSGHTEVVPREFEFLAKPYSVATLLQRLKGLAEPSEQLRESHT